MTKKFFFLFAALLWIPSLALAGEVKTKDRPEECGGYRDGEYHLKCQNEGTARDGYVDREHKWKNPFKGFGDQGDKKPKKRGAMPHG